MKSIDLVKLAPVEHVIQYNTSFVLQLQDKEGIPVNVVDTPYKVHSISVRDEFGDVLGECEFNVRYRQGLIVADLDTSMFIKNEILSMEASLSVWISFQGRMEVYTIPFKYLKFDYEKQMQHKVVKKGKDERVTAKTVLSPDERKKLESELSTFFNKE